jgi:hypothetical protein
MVFSKGIFFLIEKLNANATYKRRYVMSQILKVDEWQGASSWYVADVKTWTGWRAMAKVLGSHSLENFIHLLETKYKIEHIKYVEDKDLLIFSSPNYKGIHQLKLDVNRIAKKQNFQVEKWQKEFDLGV